VYTKFQQKVNWVSQALQNSPATCSTAHCLVTSREETCFKVTFRNEFQKGDCRHSDHLRTAGVRLGTGCTFVQIKDSLPLVTFLLKLIGRCLKLQFNSYCYSTVQYSAVQYSTVQYSTVQFSAVWYGTVEYSAVQYGTVQ